MADVILRFPDIDRDLYKKDITAFVEKVQEVLELSAEAIRAFIALINGAGDTSFFDPLGGDCACQTRAWMFLYLHRHPPAMSDLRKFERRVQDTLHSLLTAKEYEKSVPRRIVKLRDFCSAHGLILFDRDYEVADFDDIECVTRFVVVSYILTKFKFSGFQYGTVRDVLAPGLPSWKAKQLQRMQGWLSLLSVEFLQRYSSYGSVISEMMMRKKGLTVCPCFLTAAALTDMWEQEDASDAVILKLTVKRFCQPTIDSSCHTRDFFYSWSSAGVTSIPSTEVLPGTNLLQLSSISLDGSAKELETVRGCSSRQTGSCHPSVPCQYGPSCPDYKDWKRRMAAADFEDIFFTICATHPQYPGTHYSTEAKEWTSLCKGIAPALYDAFRTAYDRSETLACHRGNLNLVLFEHIFASRNPSLSPLYSPVNVRAS